jgi:hypothetical protein
MSRHWKLVAVIIGVLALAGLGVGLAVGLESGPPGGTGASSATAASSGAAAAAAQFPAAQRDRLEQGIAAPTVTVQADVVAAEVRGQFEKLGKPLLPSGSRLSIDAATFHAVSAQFATVTATVTGPQPGTWQLMLVRENGQWQLLGTRKLS